MAVQILKENVSNSIETIRKLLSDITNPTVLDGKEERVVEIIPLKKMEEMILNTLHLMHRALRGAAEILDDAIGEINDIEVETNNNSIKKNKYPLLTNEDQNRKIHILSTGRSYVLSSLSTEDKTYLMQLRWNVVKFLSDYQDIISSEFFQNTVYKELRNSTSIQKVWLKVYDSMVTTRMAWMKSIRVLHHCYTMSNRNSRSHIVKRLQKASKRFHVDQSSLVPATSSSGSWDDIFRQPSYWLGHDVSVHNIADRARIQLAHRLQELSFASAKAMHGTTAQPYVECLHHVASLCGHEYDVIRRKAQKRFEKVTHFIFCISW